LVNHYATLFRINLMKKTKKILIGFVAVISLLIILPFLIPTQTYLNQAQSIASEKLGVPVTIASGHWSFFPSPRVVVNDIAIGKLQEVKVAQVVVVPTLSSLFSSTKVIDLKVSKPIVKQAALEFISALSSKKSDASNSAVNIRHIKIDALKLDWPSAKLPDIDLEATLTSSNALESAMLETVDGTIKADVKPKGDEHLILVNLEKLRSPVGLPILIDKAKLEMYLKDGELQIPNIDVALYNGKLTGDAVANLAVKEPSSMVSKSVYLSGNLFGNGSFSGNAKEVGQLADNTSANFKFKVSNGVLHGLDLVKVASLLIKQGQNGGATEFDEFSGLLNMARGSGSTRQYHLQDLKISSGILAASGQVKVKPNKELDGAVDVEVKRSVSLVAIPLEVSGTVSKPVIFPSKAALAGAIAGTAILGPGVGTSLGVKAGGAVDKIKGLFGRK
jgi:uncharacterized protein involved in outer membrane biogenesis